MSKEEEIGVQIKTTEFWLSYFCCTELPKKVRRKMEQHISEWKRQKDVGRKHKKV